jgi:hypothetical protein
MVLIIVGEKVHEVILEVDMGLEEGLIVGRETKEIVGAKNDMSQLRWFQNHLARVVKVEVGLWFGRASHLGMDLEWDNMYEYCECYDVAS